MSLKPFILSFFLIVGLSVAAKSPAAGPASVFAGSVSTEEFQVFADKFIAPEGRVIDTANQGISHSEGQGYGLILAWMAGDKAAFETVWGFTRRELQVRDDGLFAWKWSPGDRPRVKDLNNASDGDILIAYALISAGQDWGIPSYEQEGVQILHALAPTNLQKTRSMGTVLLPAEHGFTRDDGIIINPSYWVSEAFASFETSAPNAGWDTLHASQVSVLRAWENQNAAAVPEWALIDKSEDLVEAPGFDAGFGYNALRVPLYAVRAGDKNAPHLKRIVEAVTTSEGDLRLMTADGKSSVLADPGYRALASLSRCAILKDTNARIPAFAPTDYYPSVLHLLSLSAARVKAPECVVEG